MRFDWLLVKCASFFGQLNGTLTSSYTVLVRISNDLEQVGLRLARFVQEREDTSDDDMNQAEVFSRLALVGNGRKKRNMLDCDLCNAFLFIFFGMVHPLPTQPRSLSTREEPGWHGVEGVKPCICLSRTLKKVSTV
jgi:hypothetical protein